MNTATRAAVALENPAMMKILPYMRLAVEKNASDLFFTSGAPAMIKIEGDIMPIGKQVLTAEAVRELAMAILTADNVATLARNLQVDLATQAGGLGRFRVNVFNQRSTLAIAMRYVRSEVPKIEDYGLPPILKDLILQKRGLILMVGATGSGKTTSLAAMIRHRNEMTSSHILTIEDPIEFVHPNIKSIVNQREVGIDCISYEEALVSAVREAPDVIMVGEARRRETMETCIQLANTGHLAVATLHANNAYQAMQRVVNLFPDDLRDMLYLDLSLTLRAIISQRLVKKKDGKRVAAIEVMINTPYIAELILSKRVSEIREAMAQSSEKGTQTFDDSLFQLFKDGHIDREEALSNADSRSNLEARIAFGG